MSIPICLPNLRLTRGKTHTNITIAYNLAMRDTIDNRRIPQVFLIVEYFEVTACCGRLLNQYINQVCQTLECGIQYVVDLNVSLYRFKNHLRTKVAPHKSKVEMRLSNLVLLMFFIVNFLNYFGYHMSLALNISCYTVLTKLNHLTLMQTDSTSV